MRLELLVRQAISRHAMIPPGSVVLAAVSGGADSTALLHLLLPLQPELGFRLHVAHLDHGWRGEASAADRVFVEALAARLGLPCTAGEASADEGGPRGAGREGRARAARRRFLEEAARRAGAARIATGHSRDDQAETVLLNLLRGAGLRGLAGIPPVRGAYIRPLLEAPRTAIEAWLREHGIPWREDATNRDRTLLRNRVRHELLPLLEERFRPGVAARLAAAAGLLRDDEAVLEALAGERLERLAEAGESGVVLDPEGLRREPPALARRAIRQALSRALGAGQPPPRRAVEAVLRAARGQGPATLALPGGGALVRASRGLILYAALPGPEPPFLARCSVPGRLEWPAAGLRLSLQEVDRKAFSADSTRAAGGEALLDLERTGTELELRGRRPGDRFRPLGQGGTKKLQDFLVDARVPREERDRVGLVIAGGQIAWVVGHRIDDRFKVTAATRRILRVRQERP